MPILKGNSAVKLLRETNSRCAYCGCFLGKWEVDHVIPKSYGGAGCKKNLVATCPSCNRIKGDKGLIILKKRLNLNLFYFEFLGIKKGVLKMNNGTSIIFHSCQVDPYEWWEFKDQPPFNSWKSWRK